MSEPTPADQLGYADALAELEQILDRLEHHEPDVDRVVTDVARAAELVARCRDRIDAARVRVREVVGDLDPDAAAEQDPTSAPDD